MPDAIHSNSVTPCEVEAVVLVDVELGSSAVVVVSPFINPWAPKLEKAVDSGMPAGSDNGSMPSPRTLLGMFELRNGKESEVAGSLVFAEHNVVGADDAVRQPNSAAKLVRPLAADGRFCKLRW